MRQRARTDRVRAERSLPDRHILPGRCALDRRGIRRVPGWEGARAAAKLNADTDRGLAKSSRPDRCSCPGHWRRGHPGTAARGPVAGLAAREKEVTEVVARLSSCICGCGRPCRAGRRIGPRFVLIMPSVQQMTWRGVSSGGCAQTSATTCSGLGTIWPSALRQAWWRSAGEPHADTEVSSEAAHKPTKLLISAS